MDFQSLPPYRGLPNSPRGWGEPDERGRTPSMRLRDYVALSLMIVLCFPISPSLVLQQRQRYRSLRNANSSRHEMVWDEKLQP
jgi:hypothetical protein